MRIDFHAHSFPDLLADRAVSRLAATGHITPYTDGRASSLLSAMADADIDLAVVLPVVTNPMKHIHINQAALATNEAAGKLLSFGGVHPASPDWRDTLRWLKSHGFKGIKLHPAYQLVPADDPRTLQLLEEAYALDLIVVMHAGLDISMPGQDEASVERLIRMVKAVPPRRLVLAHMGAWGQWAQAKPLLGTPGLWLDTAFCLETGTDTNLAAADFVRMVRTHGAERVLYGSDNPWTLEKRSIQLLMQSGLNAEELRLILGENGRRLLQGEV